MTTPDPSLVYVHFGAEGHCLYVGMTAERREMARQNEHYGDHLEGKKPWMALVDMTKWIHLPTREAALEREAQLTKELKPLYAKVRPKTELDRSECGGNEDGYPNTTFMERVSRWIEDNGGTARSERQIVASVKGKTDYVRAAIRDLINEGYLAASDDGSYTLILLSQYRKPRRDVPIQRDTSGDDEQWFPTALMESVSVLMESRPDHLWTDREIIAGVKGSNEYKRAAIQRLIAIGSVDSIPDGGRLQLKEPYRIDEKELF